jgi:alpha-galactosidase/6-phospho-beta-glucosidase family protein
MKISKKRLVEIINEECAGIEHEEFNQDVDEEGRMAKRQLHDMEKYARELSEMLSDTTQLESWVQAKLTKAADYLKTVKHYVEYGMEEGAYGHNEPMVGPMTAVVDNSVGEVDPGDTIDDEYIMKIIEELDN